MALLRSEGVLIVRNGNAVHHLNVLDRQDSAYDRTVKLDKLIEARVLVGEHAAIVNYHQ